MATSYELKCSPHKFPCVYTGVAYGRNTVWTRRTFAHSEAVEKYRKSRTLGQSYSPIAKSMNILVDEGDNSSVYSEWDPRFCPLAAGVLSGLFHFPVGEGDVVYVLGATCSTISHLADLVGPAGQIRAVVNNALSYSSELVNLKSMHANVWVHESEGSLGELEVVSENEKLFRVKVGILKASYSKGSKCVFEKLGRDVGIRKRSLSSIFSFLGTFPSSPALTSIIAIYPAEITSLPTASLDSYEQYLMRILQPLCTVPKSTEPSQGNLWITLSVPLTFLPTPSSDDGSDTDLICERLFDVIGSCVNRLGSFRPKEQLRLDPKYFPNTILLLSRCRKGISKAPIIAVDNTQLIEQVLASLLGSSGTGQGALPSASPEDAFGAPPGFPVRALPLDPQLSFELRQAAAESRFARGI